MVAVFALRLACGLLAGLWLLSPAEVNPRFFRVQFLTALGLEAVAAFFLREIATPELWGFLGAGLLLTFLGAIVWGVEGAPGGRSLTFLTVPFLAIALMLAVREVNADASAW